MHDHRLQNAETNETKCFVTFDISGQLFGIPITRVQDILTPDTIAAVPGGPAEVRGLINLRGRIVTVIDVHTLLSLKGSRDGIRGMCITVESRGESYTLLVDSVGDVTTVPGELRDHNPATFDQVWQDVTDGVYRTDRGLLVALNVDRLLAIEPKH